jgi:trehalose synthase-fused probable maltokinase
MAAPGNNPPLADPALRAHIERDALARFLRRQRWFGGKAQEISSARFIAWAHLPSAQPAGWVTIVEVSYQGAAVEHYHVPIVELDPDRARAVEQERPESVLFALSATDGRLCDAMVDDDACRAMADAMLRGESAAGLGGTIDARPVEGSSAADTARLPLRRLPAVHTNSAVAIGHRYLLKLFRRVERGVNPDVEIGRFLARLHMDVHVPRLLGTMEHRAESAAPAILALVQELVTSDGNAWEYMGRELGSFLSAARKHKPAGGAAIVHQLARRSLDAAALLGRRTAELHRALASAADDPDFVPEPSSPADIRTLADRIRTQSAAYLDLLHDRSATFDAENLALARRVLQHRSALTERLDRLARTLHPFVRIRIHGDYHLGQVLWTHDDFAIIDFEGEPTRPLGERRAKQSPLRDVAGMLRSFSYAAHAGVAAASTGAADRPVLTEWARAWEHAAATAFLNAYRAVAEPSHFLSSDRTQIEHALELFILEKALYELNYEMTNRPDWVSVPLSGILALAGPTTPS